MKTTIKKAGSHVGNEVTIGCWLANKAPAEKLPFYSFAMGQDLFKESLSKMKLARSCLKKQRRSHKKVHYI